MAIHPAVPVVAVVLLLPLLPAAWRRVLCVAAPLASLVLVGLLADGEFALTSFLGNTLTLLRCDALSRIFGLVFAAAAAAANLYGWHRDSVREQVAALIYGGGGLGVVFAGDLISMLFAWEIMAVASAVLVFGGGRAGSTAAGQRYLIAHVVAGSLLVFGIGGILAAGADVRFDSLSGGGWPAYAILLGLCINAAVPPLHAWLPDAYPRASIAGSVFLSTFTTKAAVYCLVRGFAGEEVLIWAGALMAVYGVVFATMEDDMRRLLSYHIVSQVGYMVCGVGIGSALAVNGAVAHAVCHILYKALLFMAVGAVIVRTGCERLSQLGGLYAAMPRTLGLYMVGALSISGAPLFNGFVSKALVVSGAAEAHLTVVAVLLNLASVGTFLSVGLKLPYFAWAARPAASLPSAGDAPPAMTVAMGVLAVLCIGLGVWPQPLYDRLPLAPLDYHPYTSYHLFESLLAMAFCGVAFWQLRGRLEPHGGRTLDCDALFRLPARWLEERMSVWLDGTADSLAAGFDTVRRIALDWVRDPTRPPAVASRAAPRQPFDENTARPPLASTLSWILIVLGVVAASLFALTP